MTEVQTRLDALDASVKESISQFFGSIQYFYETVYLVVQNGHMIQQSGQDGFEKKLETIEYYKSKIESKLDSFGLEGKEWVADIASDYFEDYVHYREASLSIAQEQFFSNLKRLVE